MIGGGQLARMMAFEAHRMGYRVAVLDPDREAPAAQVANVVVTGELDDLEAARALAAQCDVITLDTEHVPAALLQRLEETGALVRPAANVLRIIQDRIAQRRFLTAEGAPQPRNVAVTTAADLDEAASRVGFPGVLKLSRSGYDGKGQKRAANRAELEAAWEALGRGPAVFEAFIDFEKEISVLLARDTAGNVRCYPIAENLHRKHVLSTTQVPADVSAEIATRAEALAAGIAASLGLVGMMALELFVTRDGELLVNEIAPRTHNSGHYTFGACATSQFEQHLRAICGLPLGDASLLRPAVMLNLLGDLWSANPPDWGVVFAHPTARLHLYGKQRPSAGRKMGHVVIVSDSVEAAQQTAAEIEAALGSLS